MHEFKILVLPQKSAVLRGVLRIVQLLDAFWTLFKLSFCPELAQRDVPAAVSQRTDRSTRLTLRPATQWSTQT